MSHDACGCGHPHGAEAGPIEPPRRGSARAATAPVSAEARVGAVAQRSAEARAVLERLGLNHCCGAHLTLGEAAAAAGLPVEDVVRALTQALAGAA
jgi:hypothetical protein